MSHLFTPLKLRSLTIPNRIVVSPMCQYSAVEGRVQAWHHAHLGQMAISGAGMLIVEATAVEPAGRITPGCVGLYDDATESAMAGLVRMLRSVSPMPLAIQIGHAGRKASSGRPWEGGKLVPAHAGGWTPVGPSAAPITDDEAPPHAMSLTELDALKERFVQAALRADRLGFDAVEVHGAHGYLLHQFLSPIANKRTDPYGGSLENRMRWPLEVFEAMRSAWPARKPLGMRISATDWRNDLPADQRWDLPDAIEFAKRCQHIGADWIDVSSGGVSPLQKIAIGPGYQVPFAEAVKQAVKIPVMAVGMITEPKQAEEILASGKADMVALARGMLWNPRWPWLAAAELEGIVDAPRQYWRSQPRAHMAIFGQTTFGQR